MIVELTTMLMASGLVGLCTMCFIDPATPVDRYGIPASKLTLTSLPVFDGALGVTALSVGFVAEALRPKVTPVVQDWLWLLSLSFLVPVGIRWNSALLSPMCSGVLMMLNGGSDAASAKRFVAYIALIVITAVLWCVSVENERCSKLAAADVDCSTTKYDHEVAGTQKKTIKSKAKKNRHVVVNQTKRVAASLAADEQVEHDSGYSSSGDDEHIYNQLVDYGGLNPELKEGYKKPSSLSSLQDWGY